MTTDYNETEWINRWTDATIFPPNNQECFFGHESCRAKKLTFNKGVSPLTPNIFLKKLEQKMTFEEYVPFSYFFHWNDAMTDVTSITFDLHDRLNNQVLMFDLFINAVNLESLGN